jgi:hypothetical protein
MAKGAFCAASALSTPDLCIGEQAGRSVCRWRGSTHQSNQETGTSRINTQGYERSGMEDNVVSTLLRILVGVFAILHGLVHPLLAVIPPPGEEHTEEHPATMGSFWTKSWLFGEGPKAKIALYVLASLAALALLAAGIVFIARAPWAKAAWLGGAGLSLLVLVVFWKKDFVYGIGIDALMIAAAFLTPWFGG